LLANEAATVHQFTGGRFILGLGTGHGEGNSRLGIEMGQPMVKMRETVATLRKMLDGGGTGPKISGKLPIYLAGVSRPMVRMAGEIADGVIFNFFPPARVREALGEIAEGARSAGRNPAEVEPALFATAFIADDLEAARRPARTLLSRYGALRFYGNMMAKAGFEREIAAIRAAGRDAAGALAAVSDAMIDATLLVGSEQRVRERLAELCAPGIGTAIVFVNPVNEPARGRGSSADACAAPLRAQRTHQPSLRSAPGRRTCAALRERATTVTRRRRQPAASASRRTHGCDCSSRRSRRCRRANASASRPDCCWGRDPGAPGS
jgi:alkanesulfonate monooxygenase SsuD/methylene tetrahydromethanopterin reductase-like flavin-dependent oxidoreductase (luciferase family)